MDKKRFEEITILLSKILQELKHQRTKFRGIIKTKKHQHEYILLTQKPA